VHDIQLAGPSPEEREVGGDSAQLAPAGRWEEIPIHARATAPERGENHAVDRGDPNLN
jgi:hypothetical protein